MDDRLAFFALLAACMLAACSSPSAPGLDPDVGPEETGKSGATDGLLHTDRTEYEAERVADESRTYVALDVSYALANTTSDPVFLIGCQHPPAPVLQKRVEGEWQTAYAPVELLCLSPPWTVAPGSVRRDTLRAEAHLPGQNIAPAFEADEIDGMYRLVQPSLYYDADGEKPLPLRRRVSNTFTLKAK